MILLDTHVLLWWVRGEETRLSERALAILGERLDTVAVSVISCFEVAMLARRGRIELDLPPLVWFQGALQVFDLELAPITPVIACRSVELPAIHRDPIDRMLIATVLERDAELLSADHAIRRYPGVRVVW